MNTIKFKELLEKEEDLQKIIYAHCHLKITLTSSQLNEVIRLRDKKKKREWEE